MKFVLLLSALFATTTFGIRVQDSNYDAAAASECRKNGGRYKKVGLMGNYSCVKTYKDAFKSCTKSDDCLGDCIADTTDNPIPYCQPDDSKFGCWNTIEKVNAGEPIICRD